ncbi:OmpP1/FadL family transporter [Dysgonomonas macrotermitis]|uniref:Outer membrane protein transport protein (OMPP1/FadL/TodX) n=1 Tax=Dysgonomonas macrotermitis TaxID=1346286 RepID=A0A1M5DAS7_9BACT|nr:outer membrane protein transport protein [Dysgonomonas macrotermitis]SHF64061.1 Outer membrane protein transport protein (OMPP1/FadL/TodX) [Dysgonomonas macrotermitis]
MKRIFTLALVFSSVVAGAFAQGELDAFNLSYNDLKGTARSIGMGGAMGALGGDISAISINPAGIGVYKSSEVVTTLNFTNNSTKTNLTGTSVDESKFKFSFDNLAFVGVVPINSDVVPLINFGFSYNRLKSFDRKISMQGDYVGASMTDYIADLANNANVPASDLALASKPFRYSDLWMPALGYNSGIITGSQNNYQSILAGKSDPSLDNNLNIREKGSVDTYDFNVGTTFADVLSAGITVSVTDINYHMTSTYSENMYSGDTHLGEYFLDNYLKTEGTGWQVKAGLIFKPVKELRIGVAYHSPTWYEMTDYYSAAMESTISDTYIDTWNEVGNTNTDYKFRTPDKWVFSLAGVIGRYATISADYELTGYGRMHLADRNGNAYSNENGFIKEDFKNSSTIRVGAEVLFTPEFSGRIGYMWQQSPYEKEVKDGNIVPVTAGTVTHYTLVGDANYFTWGLGYQFTRNFYTDIAFVIKNRKDNIYSFEDSDRGSLKTSEFTGLLTLGCRF